MCNSTRHDKLIQQSATCSSRVLTDTKPTSRVSFKRIVRTSHKKVHSPSLHLCPTAEHDTVCFCTCCCLSLVFCILKHTLSSSSSLRVVAAHVHLTARALVLTIPPSIVFNEKTNYWIESWRKGWMLAEQWRKHSSLESLWKENKREGRKWRDWHWGVSTCSHMFIYGVSGATVTHLSC